MRAPAAVLLRLLTQKSKARQSRPPSPRPPPSGGCSEGGGGKRGSGRTAREGEGKSAGRRLPRAVARVVPAPDTGPHLRPSCPSSSEKRECKPATGTVTRTFRPILLSRRLDYTSDPRRPPLSRRPGSAHEWASRPAHLGDSCEEGFDALCPRGGQSLGLRPQSGFAPQGSLVRVCWKRSRPSRQPLNMSEPPPGHRVYPFPLNIFAGSSGHMNTVQLGETCLLGH